MKAADPIAAEPSALIEHPADQLGPWPDDGLETVSNCPVCGSPDGGILHDDLEDWSFRCAGGRWTMMQCRACRSAYLDPRPTPETIGHAYSRYYTHREAAPAPRSGFLRKLSAAVGNDYRNARYGTKLKPALPGGRFVPALLPQLGAGADVSYRFLPRRATDPKMRVLDVGCGSGEWLTLASEAGWQVAGSEPDEAAAKVAERGGVEVRQFVTDWLDQPGAFDAITSNHSIEHVHDPAALLRAAHALLRPGGFLFIQTPNIDAAGHDIYGRYWRGLEVPRHLVLFNAESLRQLISRIGFTEVRLRKTPSALPFTSLASRRMAEGLDPETPQSPRAEAPRINSGIAPEKAEYLTFTARKAPSS
jgi:2-polyprenyl-3-methyl-5-hydroxy-6-metoxy-1,4-benzoquinol methylase